MQETLQEFTSSGGARLRIDRQASVLRGVKLLGLESQNGRRYLPEALAQAVGLYEGAKVNVNHPKGHATSARDYQDRLGTLANVRVQVGAGLFGDLHFNPHHALAEQLLWDAANAPQNVGLSHNVEARTSRRDGQTVVEAILRVQSVDLVADPATTKGLFEAQTATAQLDKPAAAPFQGLTLVALREARPDLVAEIEAPATAELLQLRRQLDEQLARQAASERRATVRRVLSEFRLPDPDVADAVGKTLVSDLFLESLLAAPDESAMRRLAADRANLVAASRQPSYLPWDARPLSREQQRTDYQPRVSDAETFARAIS